MNNNRFHLSFSVLFACVLALAFAVGGRAQGVTTAAVTGFIMDSQGKPVPGASVVVVHDESGTRYSTTTRALGQYTLDGLRPGGPYSVTASAKGFLDQKRTGVFLDVGAVFSADLTLSTDVVTLQAFKVTESRDTTFSSGAMSNGLTLNADEIGGVVSVRRDVQDIENLDPRVNIMQSSTTDPEFIISVQGQNPKNNAFMIDGVSATDNFGLNSNGYAGMRNPLPMEWIGSLSFDISPYDITNSGFMGALLNTTLKSGTNTLHGSFYSIYSGTKFRGPNPAITSASVHEATNKRTTGVALGGPLIRNKLFFFVGYDAYREISDSPSQLFNPADNAADAAIVSQIIAKAKSYGYDPGTLTGPSHVWQQNFVAKFDWNISDAHKFEFTFRHTAGKLPNFYSYTSSFETSLSSSWYNSYRTDQSYTAKFNSDWSSIIPNLHTEIEGTYKRYNGTATLAGAPFPAITILNVPGTSTIQGQITNGELFLGNYYAYQLNNLWTWEQEEHLYAEYPSGNHTFKFGAQFDRTGYTDTFVPNYLGSYGFSNVNYWLAGTPTGMFLETPYTGYTLSSDVSHYYLMDISPLIQDTWRPNANLTVLAGVRMDYPYEPQKPIPSALFYNTWGFTNSTTMNGNYVISPRLGFNYTFDTDHKTQLHGGVGLFMGQNPVIWVENSFNNAGQLSQYVYSNSTVPMGQAQGTPYLFQGLGTPQALPPASIGTNGGSPPIPSFNTTDPNFKWPSNWKENIAFDRELPVLGLILTLAADFSQVQKDVFYQQLNYKVASSGPAFMPDGAIRYAGNITPSNIGSQYFVPGYTTSNFYKSVTSTSSTTLLARPGTGTVYELTNTNKGASQEYSIVLRRPMRDHWAFSIAYSHTHATQVSPLPSNVASSNYIANIFVNPNDNVAYASQFEVPDKFVITGTREFNFFRGKHARTTLSAQFIAQTGQPYSFVFKGDADGSGLTGDSLFYVPSGPDDPKVAWISPTEKANFFQYLSNTPDLAKWAGQIAPRNSVFAPWQHTLNLHLEQEIPVYGSVRVRAFIDCYNFANLLDKNWGIVSNYDASFVSKTIAGTGYDPNGNGGAGQYLYTFNDGTLGKPTIYSDMSRWNIQIGMRLDF
jgi:hypothetical protein